MEAKHTGRPKQASKAAQRPKGGAGFLGGKSAGLAVKLGKHSHVKAGPSYKHLGKKNHAQDMHSNRKAESQT